MNQALKVEGLAKSSDKDLEQGVQRSSKDAFLGYSTGTLIMIGIGLGLLSSVFIIVFNIFLRNRKLKLEQEQKRLATTQGDSAHQGRKLTKVRYWTVKNSQDKGSRVPEENTDTEGTELTTTIQDDSVTSPATVQGEGYSNAYEMQFENQKEKGHGSVYSEPSPQPNRQPPPRMAFSQPITTSYHNEDVEIPTEKRSNITNTAPDEFDPQHPSIKSSVDTYYSSAISSHASPEEGFASETPESQQPPKITPVTDFMQPPQSYSPSVETTPDTYTTPKKSVSFSNKEPVLISVLDSHYPLKPPVSDIALDASMSWQGPQYSRMMTLHHDPYLTVPQPGFKSLENSYSHDAQDTSGARSMSVSLTPNRQFQEQPPYSPDSAQHGHSFRSHPSQYADELSSSPNSPFYNKQVAHSDRQSFGKQQSAPCISCVSDVLISEILSNQQRYEPPYVSPCAPQSISYDQRPVHHSVSSRPPMIRQDAVDIPDLQETDNFYISTQGNAGRHDRWTEPNITNVGPSFGEDSYEIKQSERWKNGTEMLRSDFSRAKEPILNRKSSYRTWEGQQRPPDGMDEVKRNISFADEKINVTGIRHTTSREIEHLPGKPPPYMNSGKDVYPMQPSNTNGLPFDVDGKDYHPRKLIPLMGLDLQSGSDLQINEVVKRDDKSAESSKRQEHNVLISHSGMHASDSQKKHSSSPGRSDRSDHQGHSEHSLGFVAQNGNFFQTSQSGVHQAEHMSRKTDIKIVKKGNAAKENTETNIHILKTDSRKPGHKNKDRSLPKATDNTDHSDDYLSQSTSSPNGRSQYEVCKSGIKQHKTHDKTASRDKVVENNTSHLSLSTGETSTTTAVEMNRLGNIAIYTSSGSHIALSGNTTERNTQETYFHSQSQMHTIVRTHSQPVHDVKPVERGDAQSNNISKSQQKHYGGVRFSPSTMNNCSCQPASQQAEENTAVLKQMTRKGSKDLRESEVKKNIEQFNRKEREETAKKSTFPPKKSDTDNFRNEVYVRSHCYPPGPCPRDRQLERKRLSDDKGYLDERNLHFIVDASRVAKAHRTYGKPTQSYSKVPVPQWPHYPCPPPTCPGRLEGDRYDCYCLQTSAPCHEREALDVDYEVYPIERKVSGLKKTLHFFRPCPVRECDCSIQSPPASRQATENESVSRAFEWDKELSPKGRVYELKKSFSYLAKSSQSPPMRQNPSYQSPSALLSPPKQLFQSPSCSPPTASLLQCGQPPLRSHNDDDCEASECGCDELPTGKVMHLKRQYSDYALYLKRKNMLESPRYVGRPRSPRPLDRNHHNSPGSPGCTCCYQDSGAGPLLDNFQLDDVVLTSPRRTPSQQTFHRYSCYPVSSKSGRMRNLTHEYGMVPSSHKRSQEKYHYTSCPPCPPSRRERHVLMTSPRRTPGDPICQICSPQREHSTSYEHQVICTSPRCSLCYKTKCRCSGSNAMCNERGVVLTSQSHSPDHRVRHHYPPVSPYHGQSEFSAQQTVLTSNRRIPENQTRHKYPYVSDKRLNKNESDSAPSRSAETILTSPRRTPDNQTRHQYPCVPVSDKRSTKNESDSAPKRSAETILTSPRRTPDNQTRHHYHGCASNKRLNRNESDSATSRSAETILTSPRRTPDNQTRHQYPCVPVSDKRLKKIKESDSAPGRAAETILTSPRRTLDNQTRHHYPGCVSNKRSKRNESDSAPSRSAETILTSPRRTPDNQTRHQYPCVPVSGKRSKRNESYSAPRRSAETILTSQRRTPDNQTRHHYPGCVSDKRSRRNKSDSEHSRSAEIILTSPRHTPEHQMKHQYPGSAFDSRTERSVKRPQYNNYKNDVPLTPSKVSHGDQVMHMYTYRRPYSPDGPQVVLTSPRRTLHHQTNHQYPYCPPHVSHYQDKCSPAMYCSAKYSPIQMKSETRSRRFLSPSRCSCLRDDNEDYEKFAQCHCPEQSHYVFGGGETPYREIKYLSDERKVSKAVHKYDRPSVSSNRLPIHEYYPRGPLSSQKGDNAAIIDSIDPKMVETEWDFRNCPERKVESLKEAFTSQRYVNAESLVRQRSLPASLLDLLGNENIPTKHRVSTLAQKFLDHGAILTGRYAPIKHRKSRTEGLSPLTQTDRHPSESERSPQSDRKPEIEKRSSSSHTKKSLSESKRRPSQIDRRPEIEKIASSSHTKKSQTESKSGVSQTEGRPEIEKKASSHTKNSLSESKRVPSQTDRKIEIEKKNHSSHTNKSLSESNRSASEIEKRAESMRGPSLTDGRPETEESASSSHTQKSLSGSKRRASQTNGRPENEKRADSMRVPSQTDGRPEIEKKASSHTNNSLSESKRGTSQTDRRPSPTNTVKKSSQTDENKRRASQTNGRPENEKRAESMRGPSLTDGRPEIEKRASSSHTQKSMFESMRGLFLTDGKPEIEKRTSSSHTQKSMFESMRGLFLTDGKPEIEKRTSSSHTQKSLSESKRRASETKGRPESEKRADSKRMPSQTDGRPEIEKIASSHTNNSLSESKRGTSQTDRRPSPTNTVKKSSQTDERLYKSEKRSSQCEKLPSHMNSNYVLVRADQDIHHAANNIETTTDHRNTIYTSNDVQSQSRRQSESRHVQLKAQSDTEGYISSNCSQLKQRNDTDHPYYPEQQWYKNHIELSVNPKPEENPYFSSRHTQLKPKKDSDCHVSLKSIELHPHSDTERYVSSKFIELKPRSETQIVASKYVELYQKHDTEKYVSSKYKEMKHGSQKANNDLSTDPEQKSRSRTEDQERANKGSKQHEVYFHREEQNFVSPTYYHLQPKKQNFTGTKRVQPHEASINREEQNGSSRNYIPLQPEGKRFAITKLTQPRLFEQTFPSSNSFKPIPNSEMTYEIKDTRDTSEKQASKDKLYLQSECFNQPKTESSCAVGGESCTSVNHLGHLKSGKHSSSFQAIYRRPHRDEKNFERTQEVIRPHHEVPYVSAKHVGTLDPAGPSGDRNTVRIISKKSPQDDAFVSERMYDKKRRASTDYTSGRHSRRGSGNGNAQQLCVTPTNGHSKGGHFVSTKYVGELLPDTKLSRTKRDIWMISGKQNEGDDHRPRVNPTSIAIGTSDSSANRSDNCSECKVVRDNKIYKRSRNHRHRKCQEFNKLLEPRKHIRRNVCWKDNFEDNCSCCERSEEQPTFGKYFPDCQRHPQNNSVGNSIQRHVSFSETDTTFGSYSPSFETPISLSFEGATSNLSSQYLTISTSSSSLYIEPPCYRCFSKGTCTFCHTHTQSPNEKAAFPSTDFSASTSDIIIPCSERHCKYERSVAHHCDWCWRNSSMNGTRGRSHSSQTSDKLCSRSDFLISSEEELNFCKSIV